MIVKHDKKHTKKFKEMILTDLSFTLLDSVIATTDHVTIPMRFEPLFCLLKGLRKSMKMSAFERNTLVGMVE